MKKNNLNLFAVTLVASGIIGIATGCSTETTDPKVVKVAFAECGFGRQYLVEWEKGKRKDIMRCIQMILLN